jgi:hypothetical protein
MNGFEELFKPLNDALKEATEQIKLATECKMRRFYLVPTKWSGMSIIAEGVVFEDGMVVLRWKTPRKSTAIYDSIDDLLAVHGHGGKTVMRYIDAQVM